MLNMDDRRWGIWCNELSAWCRGTDDWPETFATQSAADDEARFRQEENDRHVAERHVNPFDGWKRIEPLHYEVRLFVEPSHDLPAIGA